MNLFIHIAPGKNKQSFGGAIWTPWIKYKPEEREMFVKLAANKFLRESGGVPPGSEPFMFTVYHSEQDPESVQDGACVDVKFTTFTARPQ